MTTFLLPDIGEGLQEAEIVAWHVGVGDHVVADQPLVSVETDKAVVEIPSPQSGLIAALHGEAGDVIDVGEVLVEFADGDTDDAGAIVGSLPDDGHATDAAPAPAAVSIGGQSRGRATPAVRALASALGVDLGELMPSGPDSTVTRADVETAAAKRSAATDFDESNSGTIEPLRGVRRAMDANMTRAHAQVVPATVTDEADVADWPAGTDPTVRLLRAVATACEQQPDPASTLLIPSIE